jgi:hypothetical protein
MSLLNNVFSQDYMEKISLESCNCLESISDTLDKSSRNMKLGICMIEAATPYKKQLKRDYKINLDKIETQGEELGKVIGLKMAVVCPTTLMKLVNNVEAESSENNNEILEGTIEGVVIDINDSKFIEFSVKENTGKTSKFYWFTFIQSDFELSSNYNTLKDKSIRISYITQDFFDGRINEYRSFNIIQSLDLIKD